jgi:hypothetical protein
MSRQTVICLSLPRDSPIFGVSRMARKRSSVLPPALLETEDDQSDVRRNPLPSVPQ